ncbi:unnamed protein product, partial [Staurois parvus]
MTREDCRHGTGDDQRPADTVEEMTRNCRHSTGDDDQRLRTGEDQRLRTWY